MVLGEVCNFAAYAFAPAILVTPLGALSVLIGAVSGSYILKEELGTLGKLGCAICLLGAIIIVLHAPPDEEIQTIDQILHYAIQPGGFRTPSTRAYYPGAYQLANVIHRLPTVLSSRGGIRVRHDLQGRPRPRKD